MGIWKWPGKGGEFGTALNLDIFIAVWTKVISDAIFEKHAWTVKVDPDAAFFPQRLRYILGFIKHDHVPQGIVLTNGGLGAREVDCCPTGPERPAELLQNCAEGASVLAASLSPRQRPGP